ncbi:MAG TPA: VWA domain-containing protein [Pyrinomonadaceae bacterium]|nr:VWA domain-containing protein [Pyrinomonadaceae bacterium]
MKQKIRILLLLTIGLACAAGFAPRLAAQQSDDVVKVNTDLVVLDAQVINKKTGQPVGKLKREDFELFEDGVKQEISYFGQDELPLSILLLLDVSGSVRPIIEQVGEGAQAALEQLKPQDEVAVMAFANRAALIQGFTKDRRLVSDKIREASRMDSIGRGTFLNDALFHAAKEMPSASNPASRRVVIVVTDNIAGREGKNATRRTMTELLESGSVVYGLIVRAGVGTVINVMTLGAFSHSLNPYSEETGGEMIGAGKSEVATKLAEMISHLRTRYSLGYKPTNTNEDGTFRRLKLQLATPATQQEKLVVKTKKGYYFRKG